jgi:hypothetical protein
MNNAIWGNIVITIHNLAKIVLPPVINAKILPLLVLNALEIYFYIIKHALLIALPVFFKILALMHAINA